MSQKQDYYDTSSLDVVNYSKVCLIMKARIVEAAETMTYIQVRGVFPAYLKAFWVECERDYSDDVTRCFYRPDAKAISRAEEVFYKWFPLIPDEVRPLMSAWAFCMVSSKKFGTFGKYCKKNKISRSTAYNRIDSTIHNLAMTIFKKAQLLQQPNWKRVGQLMPKSRIEIDKMATVTCWHTDDAKPAHRPDMQEVA